MGRGRVCTQWVKAIIADLRVRFDWRIPLQFHGIKVTSDAERLGIDPAMRAVVSGQRFQRRLIVE